MRALETRGNYLFNSCNGKMVPIQTKFQNNILALK